MTITIIVEGKTEAVLLPLLREYVISHLGEGRSPRLRAIKYHGTIPTGAKLQRLVATLLLDNTRRSDYVIALTDVYTGNPPRFVDATDAKLKLANWVGNEPRFFPHAAQYEFEAWLIPYWPAITELAGHNIAKPKRKPEEINHNRPPSKVLTELFQNGRCRDSYSKARDALRILRGKDLGQAVGECSELRALVNTIFQLSGAPPISSPPCP